MPFKYAQGVADDVMATARKMVTEKLDTCALPDGLGMILVRKGSAEYQSRLAEVGVLMMPAPEPVEGCSFVVCTA